MRTFLFFSGSILGSIAFQISITLWPDRLKQYAWAVKWVWLLWLVTWLVWLITHPTIIRRLFGATPELNPKSASGGNNVRTGDVRTGDVIVAPVIHFPPMQGTSQAQPPSPSARTRHEARPAPMYNLVFLRTKATAISFLPEGDLIKFYEDQKGSPALIACFRNESTTERIADLDNVRASIKYLNGEGHEVGNGVPRGCWLDHEFDLIDFQVDESDCLILVVDSHGKLYVPYIRRSTSGYSDSLKTELLDLNEPVKKIEVEILSDKNEQLLRLLFNFEAADGKFSITRA